MARHHVINGEVIPFTQEEEVARDLEVTQYLANKPMEDWTMSMVQADSTLLPRWAEDMITAYGTAGLATETVQKYNDKVSLRSQRPV